MLINNWYVLALSDEVAAEPVGVRALGHDFVLFRDGEGEVHCLSDICVHKGGSLCRGRVVDGAVECPYHGWRYNGAGDCVEIPSLGADGRIPARGEGIDARTTRSEDDYARVIPSPRRRQDPKHWVLRPVLLREAPSRRHE